MAEYIEREAICYQLEKQESIDGQPRAIRRARRIVADFPTADVVARDCYDKILVENDDMRAIIDTYGGLKNIQIAFVKLHEIETADVVPVVRCGDCIFHEIADYGGGRTKNVCRLLNRAIQNDDYCSYGMRKYGEGE